MWLTSGKAPVLVLECLHSYLEHNVEKAGSKFGLRRLHCSEVSFYICRSLRIAPTKIKGTSRIFNSLSNMLCQTVKEPDEIEQHYRSFIWSSPRFVPHQSRRVCASGTDVVVPCIYQTLSCRVHRPRSAGKSHPESVRPADKIVCI